MGIYYIENDYPNIKHYLKNFTDKIIIEDSNITIYPIFRSR